MFPSPGSSRILAATRRRVREHWLFAVVATCATGLRVVVLLAYQQALIFPDSERYLQYAHSFAHGQWAPDWLRTSGYSVLLIPSVLARNLTVMVAVQHLLGLVTGVLIYITLIRFGARRWLAALATIPVLFDPLQLDIEQYILTDVSATFLVVVALVVLAWKRDAIGPKAALTVGLLIAGATVIRESDLLVIMPVLVYLAILIRPWRRLAVRAGILLAGCLVPVAGYLIWVHVWFGVFNFINYSPEFMYGRIAQFAECTGLSLPSYEQHLCPSQPPAQRNPDFYMWAPQSPQVTLKPPPGMAKSQVVDDFDWRILKHQPLAYLEAVGNDIWYSFSPVRGAGPEGYPTRYHDFHPFYPGDKDERAALVTYSGSGPRVEPALADFLTGYGHDFYVPGPVLGAGLVLGLAGVAGIGRARRSRLRADGLLFTFGAIFLIVPPFVIATFDWRYELPQFSLIPVAAVLGWMAMTGRTRDTGPADALNTAEESGGTPAGAPPLGTATSLPG